MTQDRSARKSKGKKAKSAGSKKRSRQPENPCGPSPRDVKPLKFSTEGHDFTDSSLEVRHAARSVASRAPLTQEQKEAEAKVQDKIGPESHDPLKNFKSDFPYQQKTDRLGREIYKDVGAGKKAGAAPIVRAPTPAPTDF